MDKTWEECTSCRKLIPKGDGLCARCDQALTDLVRRAEAEHMRCRQCYYKMSGKPGNGRCCGTEECVALDGE